MLLEFAVSIGVLWLIVAASLEFGRAYLASHVLQTAARTAARELALDADVAWNASFDDALSRVFDADYLVIDQECLEDEALTEGITPGEHLATILSERGLILNQMLRPLMIREDVDVGGQVRRLLRYPGALMAANTPASGAWDCVEEDYAIGIPEVNDALSSITFHPVVQEIEEGGPYFSLGAEPDPDAFLQAGTVALQIHYPFQASGMSNWRLIDPVDGVYRAEDTAETAGYAIDYAVDHDDQPLLEATELHELDAEDADGALQAYALTESGRHIPVYGGSLGLGDQLMLGRSVRPFRRLISAQAVAPREVVGL